MNKVISNLPYIQQDGFRASKNKFKTEDGEYIGVVNMGGLMGPVPEIVTKSENVFAQAMKKAEAREALGKKQSAIKKEINAIKITHRVNDTSFRKIAVADDHDVGTDFNIGEQKKIEQQPRNVNKRTQLEEKEEREYIKATHSTLLDRIFGSIRHPLRFLKASFRRGL